MIRKIGKGLIIVAFVLSMAPYVTGFMIPVVLIGIILIWVKRKSIGNSILWSLWPFLLWYPAYVLMTLLSIEIDTATSQKFDFIFPQDFTGEVIVIGESTCGQQKNVKNGREQLFVPESGILLYNGFIKDYGLVNHRFFYQTNNEAYVEIPRRSENGMFWDRIDNKPPSQLNVVWGSGMGKYYSKKIVAHHSCLRATVGSIDSLQVIQSLESMELLEKETDSLILNCRN